MGNQVVSKTRIKGMMETVKNLYLADEIPWVIGFSGGKDSTAALELVWLSIAEIPIENRIKPIHIINTDTMVESPVVAKWAQNALKMMDKAAREQQLPFLTHRLTPEYNQTFWVNFIGRGYPFPRRQLRWCTDRLKIQPVNNFIKNKIAEHGEIILVLGTRKAESANRARSMEYYEKKRVRELLSPNPTLANELVFSPLEDWKDNDVWAFLMQYKNPWGIDNKELLTLYRGATEDGECPIVMDDNTPSCGNSRFGCWVCTVVSKDRSMAAMIKNDEEKKWMKKMLDFRDEFGNTSVDRERRSFRKMQGYLQGSNGKLHHGPYKKEWREHYLRRLLEVQKEIQSEGPNGFENLELITLPELQAIRRIWVYEKHEFDDMVPEIYKEITGEEMKDPQWISPTNYSKTEWNLLKEVCEEEAPEEELLFEMMYSLLDEESRRNSLNQRMKIKDSLKKVIQNNFYKNEEDATEYYSERIQRKKELGGKYKVFIDEENVQAIANEPVEAEDLSLQEEINNDYR